MPPGKETGDVEQTEGIVAQACVYIHVSRLNIAGLQTHPLTCFYLPTDIYSSVKQSKNCAKPYFFPNLILQVAPLTFNGTEPIGINTQNGTPLKTTAIALNYY